MVDRLFESNSMGLPEGAVCKKNPFDSFPGSVLDRLPKVSLLELGSDALYLDEVLQAAVNLDGEIAECASHRELSGDLLILVVSKNVGQHVAHDYGGVGFVDIPPLRRFQNLLVSPECRPCSIGEPFGDFHRVKSRREELYGSEPTSSGRCRFRTTAL